MIQLSEPEKQWIRLAKGHLKKVYPYKGRMIQTAKPLFLDIYGWNPDEDNNYKDYCDGLFKKLLDIHLKIQDDQSNSNFQLYSIFKVAFNNQYKEKLTPIERAINQLFSLIQNTPYLNDDKQPRYEL
jgi:hypothetical protein